MLEPIILVFVICKVKIQNACNWLVHDVVVTSDNLIGQAWKTLVLFCNLVSPYIYLYYATQVNLPFFTRLDFVFMIIFFSDCILNFIFEYKYEKDGK